MTVRSGTPGDVAAAAEDGGAEPVRLEGITKRFGSTTALDGVSFAVRSGTLTCLLGPNGAGKTTALSIVLGLRRPDEGSVRLCGRDPRRRKTRESIGSTPQEARFPGSLRVREIVRLVAAHYASPIGTDLLLETFGLAALARRQAGGLSGGQRRRLSVALAFVGRPRFVFLDEPTANLDTEARRLVWEAARGFVADGGTILFTTHYLDEAETVADDVIALAQGRVALRGTVDEIRRRVGLTRIELPTQDLQPLAAVRRRVERGGRLTLFVEDPADAIRELVAAGADLADLRVQPVRLEESLLDLLEDGR